jgi:hypothetical protein
MFIFEIIRKVSFKVHNLNIVDSYIAVPNTIESSQFFNFVFFLWMKSR